MLDDAVSDDLPRLSLSFTFSTRLDMMAVLFVSVEGARVWKFPEAFVNVRKWI